MVWKLMDPISEEDVESFFLCHQKVTNISGDEWDGGFELRGGMSRKNVIRNAEEAGKVAQKQETSKKGGWI